MTKLFFLPVNTGYAVNGEPSDRLLEFYSSRSGNGLYCAIVGNVIIPDGFGSNDSCSKISTSKAWQKLASAIEFNGARSGIQLSSSWNNYFGMTQFEASCNHLSTYYDVVGSLSSQDVETIFNNLRHGIELSVKAGFRHIQIHAAHGYIFSLLIDNKYSKFSDVSISQLNEIAKDLSKEKIESSLRISLISGDPKIDENRGSLIDLLCDLPFSFIDISTGYYNVNKHLIYPVSSAMLQSRFNFTIMLADRFPSRQFILSGKSQGIRSQDLPPNVHIGIARDLIANPDFLSTYQDGCVDCMQCHYYSRGESSLGCGKWQK
ncbi:MAG: oxidoreductase [Desulfuromonadaceae bacterium]